MVFLAMFFVVTKRMKLLGQIKKCWPVMLVISIVVLGFDILGNIGFLNYNVSTGAVLLRSEMIFVFIITVLILKERQKWYEWLIVFIMLGGVVFAIDIDYANAEYNGWSLMFIGSGLLMAISAFLIKWMQINYNINTYVIVFFNNIVALLSYGIISFATGDILHIGNDTAINFELFYVYLLFGSITQTGQMLIYYKSIEKIPIWKTKSFCLLVPVICTVLSIFIFHEQHSELAYMGIGIVIVCAFALTLLSGYKSKTVGSQVLKKKNGGRK
jgi:drug/metabolite transporter (DMT)-like permease